jgi:hypothetical protein
MRIFRLELRNDGKVVDALPVYAGHTSVQREALIHPTLDRPGSLRPIPEGVYGVGPVEDRGPGRSWGEGIGRYWIDLPAIPQYHANNRSAFGIHDDDNRSYSLGSAGCIVPPKTQDLYRILGWCNAANPPKYLAVDYGFGWLNDRGYAFAKKPEPRSGKTSPDVRQKLLKTLSGESGLVAVAVGYSEGNRTPDGCFTESYHGHTDPGNGARNIGSFSYQVRQGGADTPAAADALWLSRLSSQLLPRYLAACDEQQADPGNLRLWLNVCDLYTQSPAACLHQGGLLDQLRQIAASDYTRSSILHARVQSYYEPDGRLNAPGFGNNEGRLRADQGRRMNCLEDVMELQK